MHMRRKYLGLGACLAALALAGCGAGQSAGQAPSAGSAGAVHNASLAGIHACRLVSPAVIRSVFGQAISPVRTSLGGPQNCFFQPAGAGGFTFPVVLTVIERAEYDLAKQTATQGEPQGYRYMPVSGVGDDAFAVVSKATFELDAARGGLAVRINTSSTSQISGSAETRLIELIKSAIGSL